MFGQEVHNTNMNKPENFHANPMYGFWENDHNNLQLIYIFLEIHDVGFSDFWCVGALD